MKTIAEQFEDTETIRRLESENAALRKERDEESARHILSKEMALRSVETLVESNAALRAERDRLREALEKIQEQDPEENRQHADEIANAALAAAQPVRGNGDTKLWARNYAYLIGTGKCPVLFEGHLAFVSVPGVCQKAFDLADKKACEKLAAIAQRDAAGKEET